MAMPLPTPILSLHHLLRHAKSMRIQRHTICVAFFTFALCTSAHAQLTNPLPSPIPLGLNIEIEPWLTIPASKSTAPRARINHVKPCPDGVRLFCNDLRGKFWVIASTGANSATEFLDMSDHFPNFIDSPGLGSGFSSFAFHPEFFSSGTPGYGKFYTTHTESPSASTPDFIGPVSPTTSQVSILTEWTMTNPSDNSLTTSSGNFTMREVLRVAYPYHFHGQQEIAFDPNASLGDENYGSLFLCVGDGGSMVLNLPQNMGRIDSPLGTIFRITPLLANGHSGTDFTLSTNGNYYIPSGATNSNPFIGASDPTPGDGFPVVREIYAYGFRNPHRISWDTGGTGKMFCGVIGEQTIEEIELVKKGHHYGWPVREGSFLFTYTDKAHVYPLPSPDTGPVNSPPEPATYSYPVSQYDHGSGGAAVVGGYVYRGAAIPSFHGKYVFGDITSGLLYAVDESLLELPGSTVTGGTPAPPKTVGIKVAGTLTTFKSVVGGTRADLRFGVDHSDELYMLSKQNGTIYRVLDDPDSGVNEPPIGTASDWATVHNFESGELNNISTSISATSAQVVDDPQEGAANRVLRIQAVGSNQLIATVPVPEIPDNAFGTLFFRLYLTDILHNYNWGLSDVTNPNQFADFEVQMRSYFGNNSPSPFISVREGGSFTPGFEIEANTWYSIWCQIDNINNNWDLYVQGGAFTAPTLVRNSVAVRNGDAAALHTFMWILNPASPASSTSAVYFDDLHVDIGHANILPPAKSDWQLVDDFEQPSPLDAWDLANASSQSNIVAVEADGNHYLQRAASVDASPSTNAIAARELPFTTQVGETITTFFRFKTSATNLRHSYGVSALDPADPATYTEGDFEPQIRLTSGTDLDLYDGPAGTNGFIDAANNGSPIAALATDTWYKVWMVADNRGFASAGQTWQAYIKGGVYDQPTAISDVIFARRQAEAPITHLLSIATTGSSSEFGNASLCIDDIYAFKGVNLSDPLALEAAPISLQVLPQQATLTVDTVENRSFQVFESEDLAIWTPLGDVVEGSGTTFSVEDSMDSSKKFFQALTLSPRAFTPANWSTDFADATLPEGMYATPGATWALSTNLYSLTDTPGQVSGMVRRPEGYTLAPGNWRNVDLTVEARSLELPSVVGRDIVLIFGYVDETHFYYAHISNDADNATHNIIMRVDGDTRSVIQSPSLPPTILTTNNWHTLRVSHDATGAIAIYVDDMVTPFMTATDTTYPAGRVGFGTFDDKAEFRQVEISGELK